MKQFRVTGIDNRTNKPLQAVVQAPDDSQAYIVARKLFASIDRIEPIVTAPAASVRAGRSGPSSLGNDLEPDIDVEEEDDEIPDLSNFDIEGRAVPTSFRALLRAYQGQSIGINLSEPDKFELAKLTSVNPEYFTIQSVSNSLIFHYAVRGIISVMETNPANPTPSKGAAASGAVCRTAPKLNSSCPNKHDEEKLIPSSRFALAFATIALYTLVVGLLALLINPS